MRWWYNTIVMTHLQIPNIIPVHTATSYSCKVKIQSLSKLFKLILLYSNKICTTYTVKENSRLKFFNNLIYGGSLWVRTKHDDVIKWKHFPRYWPFVWEIHRSPVNSPHKGPWCGALMFSLNCVWINGWVNNRQAGDLWRHLCRLWRHFNAFRTFNGSLAKWFNNQCSVRILYKLRSVQNTGTCYPGQAWFVRNPGVPDKSSRGLGSMSRYSAQILICFIAYIFLFFIPLWVWLGTLQDCQYAQCPLPLSIVIRMRLVIRQSKLPACLAEVQLAHQNIIWLLCHRLVKLTDKMDKICINGKFSVQESSEWRVFCILVSTFTVFQPTI